MNNKEAAYWISKLKLTPHPEGGYYKSSFQSREQLSDRELEVQFDGIRKLYTSIYFLLESTNVSHFHRLISDELWYFHAGSSLSIHVIHEDGNYEKLKLGLDLDKGEVPQVLVPKNAIFGTNVTDERTFALVGCMVSPGFDFQDFELFSQKDLLEKYPQHEEIIMKLAFEAV